MYIFLVLKPQNSNTTHCLSVSLLCHKRFYFDHCVLLLFTVIIYYASRRKLLADVVCVSEWEIARSSSFQAFYADFGDYSKEKERERDSFWGKAASGTLCGCNRILVWPVYYLQKKIMIFFQIQWKLTNQLLHWRWNSKVLYIGGLMEHFFEENTLFRLFIKQD